ncbi:MAG: helix-turn-helix transcriptional regulator [Gammaproteobacteria bacterium]|nr:helix-turn-helix transcriptional regulator [Gammaproteobacteria bacterium]
MNIEHQSNQKILEIVGTRFLAARLNKNMTQSDLASQSGVTEKTIGNLEKGIKSIGLLNIIAILRALEMLDQIDSFIPEPPPRAASLIKIEKIRGKSRKRASGKRKRSTEEGRESWSWADE